MDLESGAGPHESEFVFRGIAGLAKRSRLGERCVVCHVTLDWEMEEIRPVEALVQMVSSRSMSKTPM